MIKAGIARDKIRSLMISYSFIADQGRCDDIPRAPILYNFKGEAYEVQVSNVS